MVYLCGDFREKYPADYRHRVVKGDKGFHLFVFLTARPAECVKRRAEGIGGRMPSRNYFIHSLACYPAGAFTFNDCI